VTATAAELPPAPPKRRPLFVHRIEFAAWRVLVFLLSLFPLRTSSAIGGFIGRLGYFPLGIRKRLVDHQLRAALPEISDGERRGIAAASYANLGRIAVEAAMLVNMPREKILELFHPPVGWEFIESVQRSGRGALLIGGHLGNWEIGFSYFAARGARISPVGRQMRNPLFDEMVRETRVRLGLRMLGDFDFVKYAGQRLAEGDLIGILADQGAKSMTGVFVPFFGRLARTPKAPAVMALRLKAPCFYVAMVREPDGKYRAYIEPIPVTVTGDRERDVEALVTTYASMLEKMVRKYPGQYLWQHRRWRRRPDGTLDDI
jgi:KDO2-lipid IV(A) lauroyltransferase